MDADAFFRQGLQRHMAQDWDGAEEAYRAALGVRPHAIALGNLALIRSHRGCVEEALAMTRDALAQDPLDAAHPFNLGNILLRVGRLEEAVEAYRHALPIPTRDKLRANISASLGSVLLALGDDHGWSFYDGRPERIQSVGHSLPFPEWKGEDLSGKSLFIYREQGFGDQILAARYFRGLGAAKLTAIAMAGLERLYEQFDVTVMLDGPKLIIENHDYWALPMSLPRWGRPVPPEPYLTGSPSRRGGVGIAWNGNAMPDPGRTLPQDHAQRLLALPGAVSLAPEDTGARDFQDTADIIAGLDLVVSIDTSVAHLAGAMGKPCWVLLQHYSRDWRWRAGEDGKPVWYPTSRLFYQPKPGDWSGAIDAVEAELAAR